MKDPILKIAFDDLTKKHGCHTVILYGSRSRGDFTEESDYDLAGFRDGGEMFRDARVIEGKYLDAFVYPTSYVIEKEDEFLKIRNGTVLIEKESFGKKLLGRLEQMFKSGPKPLPEYELQVIRVWIEKMLKRIAKGDIEGNFRRSWLQFDLLECYFKLRGQWYLGPKESIQWLSTHDPKALFLFEKALMPNASYVELEKLALSVLAG